MKRLGVAIFALLLAGCVQPNLNSGGKYDFHLAASDGWRLSAYEVEPESPNGVGLVLIHQMQGGKEDWLPWAAAAAKRGFHVVAIDLRGHGGSTSPRAFVDLTDSDFGNLPLDVQAAIDYSFLAGNRRVVPIGASIGANAALIAATQDPRIASVVLLSPGVNYHDLDATAPAAGFDGRILSCASENDSYSIESSRRLFAGNPRFAAIAVPGSAHGVALLNESIWQDILRFAA